MLTMNFRLTKPFLKRGGNFINKKLYTKDITTILKNGNVGDTVTIKGWVKSLRKQKDNVFLDLSDGSSEKKIQIILDPQLASKDLNTGASVNVEGSLAVSPKGQIELRASKVDIYSDCIIAEGYPFAPRKTYAPDYIRQYLHFRPRTNKFASLLRIRSAANAAIHNYFNSEGFIHIHTPILTSNDSEGAGEVFKIIPDNTELLKTMVKEKVPLDQAFFDKKAYLSVSGQLHLEAAVHGLSKVYSFGPTFRSENSKTRLHLSEFYMLESEIAFLEDISRLTFEIEKLIKTVTKMILDTSQEDVAVCNSSSGKDNVIDYPWLNSKFTIMSYAEAVDILDKNKSKLKTYNPTESFSKEQEIFLVEYNGGVPIFVIDWPKKLKAFYRKECNNDDTKVSALDLLVPNVGEVVGGSLRENDYNKLKEKLPSGNSDFDWYLELRKFGGVPTGGYGLGFERYLMFLLGISSIKDVIPFPRWPHNCNL